MGASITLKLQTPVTFGSSTYTELSLSEPTMGQIRISQRETHDFDKLAVLINQNAKVPMAVVDLLSQTDVEACADFFASTRQTKPGADEPAPT